MELERPERDIDIKKEQSPPRGTNMDQDRWTDDHRKDYRNYRNNYRHYGNQKSQRAEARWEYSDNYGNQGN